MALRINRYIFVLAMLAAEAVDGQDRVGQVKRWNTGLVRAAEQVWADRAAALAALMREDPAAALAAALPAAEAAQLRRQRPDAGQWLEEWGEWEGEAERIVHDNFAEGTSQEHLYVRQPGGASEVHLAGLEPLLRCGDRIRVEGLRLGGQIAGRMAGPVVANREASSCTTTGEQKVAVLLLQFPGNPLPPGITPASFQPYLTGATNSLDGYWREASGGATSASGSVFGPFTLTQSYACSETDAIRTAAIAAADATVDFRLYTRIILVFPGNCGGLGNIGCGTNTSPTRGSFTASFAWLGTDFASSAGLATCGIIHELGHGLGLGHASSLSFGTLPLGGMGTAGTHTEYGDNFSLMGPCYSIGGSYLMGHYAGPHKQMLGWLGTSNFQQVESSGTFTLAPYSQLVASPQVLRVRRGIGNDRWLWIEYRQASGYDATLASYSTQALTGALIHYEDPAATAYDNYTRLLNFRAASNPGSFSQPALAAGQSWTDPYSELRLTVTSANSAGMTVQVDYDASCAALTPGAQTVGAGATTGTVTVSGGGACAWTALSNDTWITVTSGASGTGNGTVGYSVTANTTVSPRTGSISIGRQSFSITQNSTNNAPAVTSMTPNSGSVAASTNQVFTAVFTDLDGASSLNAMSIWFSGSPSQSNACYIQYRRSSGQLRLYDDGGGGYSYTTIGFNTTLTNNQCQVNAGSSTATVSGNTLTLRISAQFRAAFAGARGIYGSVTDTPGAASGTQTLGSITVTTGTAITLTSVPAGLQVLAGGVAYTTPAVISVAPGASLALDVPSPQTGTGSRAVFASWSDGGAKAHSITATSSPATYTATFTTQYLLTATRAPLAGGSITASPASGDGYYNSGTSIQLTATAASGYAFSGFSGGVTGTVNPRTFAMNGATTVTANFTCTYGFGTASAAAGAGTGSGTVMLNTGAGCPVTPVAGAAWLTVTPASATGTTTLTFNYTANTTGAPRSANITAGGQTFTVTQAAGSAGSSPVFLGSATTVTGSPQTFSFAMRDTNGFADISRLYFLVNTGTTLGANVCHGYYERAANALYLYNDALTSAAGPLTPGTSGTLANTQCQIDGSTSALAAAAGTDLTVNVGMRLLGSFAASPKNVYGWVVDAANTGTGWVQESTWNPGGAAPQAPVVVSGSPASSTATTQTFSSVLRDGNGFANISRVYFLVNTSATVPANSCHGFFDRAANAIYLYNDSLSTLSAALTPGSGGSVSNSQCRVNGTGSGVTSASGTDLGLNLNITLLSMAGSSQKVYVWVTDTEATGSGWVQTATWGTASTTPVAPSVAAATPATSAVSPQAFSFTLRDANGAANISRVYFLVNSTATVPANSCHGFYDRAANAIYLFNDALSALQGPVAPGGGATLSNSQCGVNGASSSASVSGTDLALTLGMNLNGSYGSSAKNVYVWVTDADGLGSGWVQTSTWGTASAAPQPPVVVSGTPSSSTSATQAFTVTTRDANGAGNINRIYFLVNSTPTVPANTCHGFYDRAANAVYLFNNALSALVGPLTPGAGGTLANSQCTVQGATSSASASGTDLVLTLGLTKTGSYSGTSQKVYFWVTDTEGTGSGWVQTATWGTAGAAPQPPVVVSGTPSAPTGSPQTFTVVTRDANGAANMNRVYFLVNSAATVPANSCHGFYDRATNSLYLYNDALTAALGPLTPGSGGTLANSQCSLAGATSAASAAGTDLTLSLGMSLTAGYANVPRNVYFWVTDMEATGSGWVQTSTWGTTGQAAQAPTLVSASPTSSGFATQLFTLTARDANGVNDLHRVYFLVNTSPTVPSGSCHGFYDRATNAIFLYNDNLSALTGPLAPGAAATLQNSQCRVNGAATTVSASGTDLVLGLSLTRIGSYATGTRSVYVWITDTAQTGTGWVQTSNWTL